MTNNIETIERTMVLKASQNQVWEALTIPDKLSQWFGQTAQFKLETASIGSFGWDDHGQFAMRIEQINPQIYFCWRWMAKKDMPFEESQSTLVEWKLTALSSGDTELYMQESGFKTQQSRADNVGGWQQELGHLEDFLILNKQA